MGKQTTIEWTGATWNPWRGCRKVSPGCKFCYMFREQKRFGSDPTQIVRAAKATFTAPLRWKEPNLVFTCSWSDFFIEEADPWRADAWAIIRQTPHLIYQILTKRPERIAQCLPPDWGDGYPNVMLGVTTEDQARANTRIVALLRIPARWYFVSAEPLLGPITFTRIPVDPEEKVYWDVLNGRCYGPDGQTPARRIHWVIAGGESGYNGQRRDCDLAWLRHLRDQCVAAGIPFYLKQLGGSPNRKRGGHEALLDGQLWHQMPALPFAKE